jgi:RHS repeat-associated protein
VTLTAGSWYNAKVVVDKPDTSQRLRFWVDEDGDGFDAGDLLLTSTAVDDDWLGGYVGLFKGAGMTTVHQFDDFKLGFDDDSDDTLDVDEVVLHDDFDSTTITLTHDDNGNLTYDGVYEYVYDFLNRLVKVKYAEPGGGADVTVAEHEYDGMNRRIRKLVQNFGEGVVPGSDEGGTITGIQAGNRHEHYYYAGWRVIEERDNSEDVLAQMVWSTEYIDAPVCRDRNTNVGEDNEDYSSCIDAGSERYFYHQGPNYRVWALTDESGDVVERYDYDAYGEPRLYAGHDSSVNAELGNALFVSSVGNPYMHQGLRRDDESGLHENRFRAYHSRLGRFIQRDPAGYIDSMNLYQYVFANAWSWLDPLGLQCSPADIALAQAQLRVLRLLREIFRLYEEQAREQASYLRQRATNYRVFVARAHAMFMHSPYAREWKTIAAGLALSLEGIAFEYLAWWAHENAPRVSEAVWRICGRKVSAEAIKKGAQAAIRVTGRGLWMFGLALTAGELGWWAGEYWAMSHIRAWMSMYAAELRGYLGLADQLDALADDWENVADEARSSLEEADAGIRELEIGLAACGVDPEEKPKEKAEEKP